MKAKPPGKPPLYFFYVNFPTHILILAGWWRACCRGGAANCPGPTSCPTCGAKCPCWRQPRAQEALRLRLCDKCTHTLLCPAGCTMCPSVHSVLACAPLPAQSLLKAHAYHQAYKCMCSRGRTLQPHIDNQSEYAARVLAWCTGRKGSKILGCIKETIPEDGKTSILTSGCAETSVLHSFDHHIKINSNSNVSWEKLSRMRRRMESQNIKELVSFSLANGHREGDNYPV